jgi:hypothetical protein
VLVTGGENEGEEGEGVEDVAHGWLGSQLLGCLKCERCDGSVWADALKRARGLRKERLS